MPNRNNKDKLGSKLQWMIIIILFIASGFSYYRKDGIDGLQAVLEGFSALILGGSLSMILGSIFLRLKDCKYIFFSVLAVSLIGLYYYFDPKNLPIILWIAIPFGIVIFIATALSRFFGKR